MRTSSRYIHKKLKAGQIRITKTNVESSINMIFSSPSDFRGFSFPKTKYTKHLTDPTSHILHDSRVQVLSPRVDVYIRLGHKISENVKRIRGIEGIAK
jgi:hypothetical protein